MMIEGLTNKSCSSVYETWFGQFGTAKMLSALSVQIFCNTSLMHENGEKLYNFKFIKVD